MMSAGGYIWTFKDSIIRRYDTGSGATTDYTLSNSRHVRSMVLGEDGNAWFVYTNNGSGVGRITSSGVITYYTYSSSYSTFGNHAIAYCNGYIYQIAHYAPYAGLAVVRMNPSNGNMTTHRISLGASDKPMRCGSDGNLYISSSGIRRFASW